MIQPPRSGWFQALILALLSTILAARSGVASDPFNTPLPKQVKADEEAVTEIKPLPLIGISDDPPPHEGALVDFPLVIEPPDIIIVEVLEALPGRPITGERLVRPDGTITLGFYGDIHVRGLTTDQVKVKVVHQLRKYLNDDVLGLRIFQAEGSKFEPLPPPGTKVPVEMVVPQDNRPFEKPDVEPPVKPAAPDPTKQIEPPPGSNAPSESPKSRTANKQTRASYRKKRTRVVVQEVKTGPESEKKPDEPAQAKPEVKGDQIVSGEAIYIDPVETIRVFVDLASYNTKVYYVQGDVASPGRLPFTGKETVLDALIFVSGLIPTAEPSDIHLYRPARGDKPAKDYLIDHASILKGDPKANLQIFPNDRLVVGRNPTVTKTIDMDRAAAPINSSLNSALQYAFTARSLGLASGDISGTTQAQRDEALKRWVEFLWGFSSKEGKSLLDEKALRESLLRKLDPVVEPK